MLTTALALVLLTPVPGPIARPFSYVRAEPFVAGRHRGTDFVAGPGAPVRAACSGRVVAVRPRVVTLRCGPWRVTHLPLASVSVRLGSTVPAGTVVGRVGRVRGHIGLHLGVRRADDRFGYVDPERFLTTRRTDPPPPASPRRVPRTAPSAPHPAPAPLPIAPPSVALLAAPASLAPTSRASAPLAPSALMSPPSTPASLARAPLTSPPSTPASLAPAPLTPPSSTPAQQASTALASAPVGAPSFPASARASPPAPRGARVRVSSRALAPWPAWAGLALLLLGSAGGGLRMRRRRRRAAVAVAVASPS